MFKSSFAGEGNVSTLVGPDEVSELGKGEVMSHLLKGICLYVKSNGNPQRLCGEWLAILHLQMPTVMKDTDGLQVWKQADELRGCSKD